MGQEVETEMITLIARESPPVYELHEGLETFGKSVWVVERGKGQQVLSLRGGMARDAKRGENGGIVLRQAE